jgi:hypothetical protein
LREKKHNPFKLRDFRGVKPEFIARLAVRNIKTTAQILATGATREKRALLAADTGIPQEALLELVRLSDLARLPGVKGIRARLYHDAGVDSVEKMAGWEPEALLIWMEQYVVQTGFTGTPPLPKEVSSTIANARKLPALVEQ